MDLTTIIKLVNGYTATAEALAPLVDQLRGVLSADEQAEVDAALQRLGAANDQLHDRLQNKLAKAAAEG